MQGTKYENQVRQLEIYAALSWGNFCRKFHTFLWRTFGDQKYGGVPIGKISGMTMIQLYLRQRHERWWHNYTWCKGYISKKKKDGILPGDGKYGNWLRLHLLTNQKTNIELEKMAPKRHFCDIVPG